jgi:hypothetical protein
LTSSSHGTSPLNRGRIANAGPDQLPGVEVTAAGRLHFLSWPIISPLRGKVVIARGADVIVVDLLSLRILRIDVRDPRA